MKSARASLQTIEFYNSTAALEDRLEAFRHRRLSVLIDAASSKKGVIAKWVDVAAQYATKVGSPESFTACLCLGERFDIFADIKLKLQGKFPSHTVSVVQLTTQDDQHARSRPSYCFMVTPPSLKTPVSCRYKKPFGYEKMRLRCTERSCEHRPRQDRQSLGETCLNAAEEILADDREGDLLQSMLAASACDEDASGDEDMDVDNIMDAAAADDAEAAGLTQSKSQKRDYVVDLWPFARPASFYDSIYKTLGSSQPIEALVILSGTAHPSAYVAARRLMLKPLVVTERWSRHSRSHSEALALESLLRDKMKACSKKGCKRSLAADVDQCIVGPDIRDMLQVLSPWDACAGAAWHDGVNKIYNSEQLEALVPRLVQKDLESSNINISAIAHVGGRGLLASQAFKEGETVLDMTSLYFDNRTDLDAFLMQSPEFRDRVVRIEGVKISSTGSLVSLWAALVGLGQYIQHYSSPTLSLRKAPNAILQYRPSCGFSSNALSLVTCTTNRAGIAKGSPVVIDYGSSTAFAETDANYEPPKRFKGILDAMLSKVAIERSGDEIPFDEAEPAGSTKLKATNEKQEPDTAAAESMKPAAAFAGGAGSACGAGSSSGADAAAKGAAKGACSSKDGTKDTEMKTSESPLPVKTVREFTDPPMALTLENGAFHLVSKVRMFSLSFVPYWRTPPNPSFFISV